MVRKTGRTGNARRKARTKEKPKVQKQSDLKVSSGDFNFQFDDERLQQQYINAWKQYEKVLPNFPKPKSVGRIDAISLTRGKNKDKLDDIKEVFTRNNGEDTKGDSEGIHHRNTVIEDIKKSIKQTDINNYVKKVRKEFKEVEKSASKKGKDFDIYNQPNKVRWNYVYYKDHPKTNQTI